MKLSQKLIDRVKQLAEDMAYGTITIRIVENGTYVTVISQVEERVPLDNSTSTV